MLMHLCIENIVIIKKAEISFGDGLTVITGSTGAGKSLILDCIDLLFGRKSVSGMVRSGAEFGSSIGTFVINKKNTKVTNFLLTLGIKNTTEIIIKRVITPSGSSKAFVNGVACKVSSLEALGYMLTSVHSQSTGLRASKNFCLMELLDEYGECKVEVNEVKVAFEILTSTRQKISELASLLSDSNAERRLEATIKDISELKTYSGEEADLLVKRQDIELYGQVFEATSLALDRIENRGSKGVEEVLKSCEMIMLRLCTGELSAELSKEIDAIKLGIKKSLEEVIDVTVRLSDLKIKISNENGSFDEIEERLTELNKIANKYFVEPKDLLIKLEEARGLLNDIKCASQRIIELKHLEKEQLQQYLDKGKILSSKRKSVAQLLELDMAKHLKDLMLSEAKLQILVSSDQGKISETGLDVIELYGSMNAGVPASKVDKIASGGEVARIMLALIVSSAEKLQTNLIIFDEIDTGVSGLVAMAMGAKMKQVGRFSQVISITHSPQVAAFGEFHLSVCKSDLISVVQLNHKERTEELAKMLGGGKVTQTAVTLSESLIDDAKKWDTDL